MAIGVLNSCVMLLMKSDLISLIRFCFRMKKIAFIKVKIMNKENIADRISKENIDS